MDSRWTLTDAERAERGMGPWTKMDDPAHSLLTDGHTSSTEAEHDDKCYICNDPEFAQMGLPLCRTCSSCVSKGERSGHVPADDSICTVCGESDDPHG